jgi:murein DD-endopeptidase MepM/ murein hydrolase activator NlpD
MSLPSQTTTAKRPNPFVLDAKKHVHSRSQTASSAAPLVVFPAKTPGKKKPGQVSSSAEKGPSASPLTVQKPRVQKRPDDFARKAERAFKALLVLLFIFILLPVSVQQQVYRLLPLPELGIPVMQQSGTGIPVAYDYVSSPFGQRWGRKHQGIDLAAPAGKPIYAAMTGKVVYSGWESGYGNSVVLQHGKGIKTRYAHCSRLLVKKGQLIPKGAVIARVGSTGHSTGPHLHFEVLVKGTRKNPAWYFRFAQSSESKNGPQIKRIALATD